MRFRKRPRAPKLTGATGAPTGATGAVSKPTAAGATGPVGPEQVYLRDGRTYAFRVDGKEFFGIVKNDPFTGYLEITTTEVAPLSDRG